ncbi:protein of unknown function [Paenibacillus sp. UNCCL117]|uniref:DUF4430 domain-containing protein n=1 Tax=unclassified Paenibacillus TaxID=185978 RepID=UPI00088346BD|nr:MULTISPECIES: DUF4430 domain-containing protein [unclassified Paenibacillus]SDE10793.1 protein of unknown function [Paenibacillus sp. cl123]SFW59845.1 protein of unknown function [Paenibacillus sp. UNCCL117]
MSRKKWLAALAVIGLLVIAFFWGGDNPSHTGRQAAGGPEAYGPGRMASPEASSQAGSRAAGAESENGNAAGTGAGLGDETGARFGERAGSETGAAAEGGSGQLEATPPDKLPAGESGEAAASPKNSPVGDSLAQQPGPTAEAAGRGAKGGNAETSRPEAAPAGKSGGVSADAALPGIGGKESQAEPRSELAPGGGAGTAGTIASSGEEDRAARGTESPKGNSLTETVPKGKPQPVEWQDAKIDKTKEGTVTLSVSCKAILNNLDRLDPDKKDILPEDCLIYKPQQVVFYEGESVFDVLLREMKKHKIHMEFAMTPVYNSHYIEGIHNIYEFDCGELSGWMYRVNGWFPNYGSSRYPLKDGDTVEWLYTCDLGRDIGGDPAAAGGGG